MNATEPMWQLIRQDAGGGRYRVARCATRAEAERIAGRLDAQGRRLYVIEQVASRRPQP